MVSTARPGASDSTRKPSNIDRRLCFIRLRVATRIAFVIFGTGRVICCPWALPGRKAPVDRNGSAGQAGRFVRREENSQISYVGGLAEAAQRNCGEAVLFHSCAIRRLEKFTDEVRFHN